MEPFPPLDEFCLAGLAAGRALGKPHRIEESDQDLAWESACELRDFFNYVEGRLNQNPGELEAICLRAALGMARNLYRVIDRAREYQREGK